MTSLVKLSPSICHFDKFRLCCCFDVIFNTLYIHTNNINYIPGFLRRRDLLRRISTPATLIRS
jgi:hypothetical protein